MFSVLGARPLVQFHFLNEEANPVVWEGMCTPLAIEIAYPFN